MKSYYDHVVADVDQLSGPAYKSVQAKTKSKSISVVTSSKGVHQRPRAEPLVGQQHHHHQPKVYPVYPSQEISGVGAGSVSPSAAKVKSVIGESNNKFKTTRHEINAVHHFSTRPYSR